jgi:hypothetical protein
MSITLFRTFLIFFGGGVLMLAAVISLFLIGGIVWSDCLHDNFNHTCGDALMFVAVSPFYGITIGMAVGFLPLLVGATSAVLGRAVFRHLPLWYVLATLLVCILAYGAQGAPWLPYDHLRPLSERLLMFSAFQVSALLICWWWDRRKTWM